VNIASHVIPAQAGIHCREGCVSFGALREWIPAFAGMTKFGCGGGAAVSDFASPVIPAKAGIHCREGRVSFGALREWIPAFAGMTNLEVRG
jgi:hypothetical protein